METKIKIGDRVKLISLTDQTRKDYPSLRIGDEGIVVYIIGAIDNYITEPDIIRPYLYCINWGQEITNGVNCDGRCDDGHGGSVKPEEVTKI
jgi:hypothetical protein